jgi:hypothetical protein
MKLVAATTLVKTSKKIEQEGKYPLKLKIKLLNYSYRM